MKRRNLAHAYRCPTCGHRIGYALTPDNVRNIKSLLRGGASVPLLAQGFGVTPNAIYKIKQGKNWKHVR